MPFRKKIDDGAERLAKIELFDGFTPSELARVAELVEEVEAEKGAVLVEQGKPGTEAYIVVEGEAAFEVAGERKGTIGPGDPVGEMALIDNRPRVGTVRAMTPMKLLVLDSSQFRKLLDEMPKANRAIMSKLSERLRKLDLG
ncbi:MAG TPA: cyclic nucleotide-binding domain-containing protein [Acidimicrobiales bacterium]|jgi:CRP-like cAMP-binding protein|nr:cyclic nucleotide-binding domain-containing protein [Acidimicrobiales bacterium]